MRIVLDAYWWHRGTTSLQRVVRSIATTWVQAFPEDEVILLVRHPGNSAPHPFPQGVSRVITTRIRPQAVAASILAPAIGRALHADAVLSQNFTPLFGKRRCTFIHDFLFVTNPEWFTAHELRYFNLMPTTAKRANLVLTSSNSEAVRIARQLPNVDVHGVGLAVDPELLTGPSDDALASQLTSGHFLLTVGRLNARKNLAAVIRGAIASEQISPEQPLVIVGQPEGLHANLDDRSIKLAISSRAVLFLDYVSDARLRWLYRNARLFVYMSVGEGFGLPPIEAALFGTPVLVSDIPVFRETSSSFAEFADPYSIIDIGEKITSLLSRDTDDADPVTPSQDWVEITTRIRSEVAQAES